MPRDVIMPALGMAQETGKVLRWLRSDGDEVAQGEPLLEIETDKVTVEIESPATGRLAQIRALEGEDVPVGQAIATILAPGEELPTVAPVVAPAQHPLAIGPRPTSTTSTRARARATPKARRMAREHGIDLSRIAGSGLRGAVLATDIEAARTTNAGGAYVPTVWRLMAERTSDSWRTVPHFYLRREVDASRLVSWHRSARARPGHERVSHTDLLVMLVAKTLRQHPPVNSTWHDGVPTASEHVNVGVAIAVDVGLVVPVVHDADRLSLAETTLRRIELVDAAHGGRLKPEDVTGGTFTVSNLGMYGVDSFDAIVNAPQAAILAVGRIAERCIPIDGKPTVRPTLQLSVACDHRVVDGARGAAFLETLALLIEEPAGLLG